MVITLEQVMSGMYSAACCKDKEMRLTCLRELPDLEQVNEGGDGDGGWD